MSAPLQKTPSSHTEPNEIEGCAHAPAPSHTSLVQALPSSAQGFVVLVWLQPLTGLQASVVQGLASLHAAGQMGAMKLPNAIGGKPVMVVTTPLVAVSMMFTAAGALERSAQSRVPAGLTATDAGPLPVLATERLCCAP